MNCRDWEERIALHAEGDLPPAEAAEAERHLAECADCREFSEGLKQSLAVLRGGHAEPLLPAHFAAVRARVLEQLEPKRRPSWRWAWIPALAAVAVLAVLINVRRPPVEPPRIAIAPPPAPQVEAPPSVAPAPRPRRVVPVRRVKKPRPPAEPLMVKLVTDDPDVVIYWIAD